MAGLSTSGEPICSRHEPARRSVAPPSNRADVVRAKKRFGEDLTVKFREGHAELHQVCRQQRVGERDVLRVVATVGWLHAAVIHIVLGERDAVLVNPVRQRRGEGWRLDVRPHAAQELTAAELRGHTPSNCRASTRWRLVW